jgi:hypothetical protein
MGRMRLDLRSEARLDVLPTLVTAALLRQGSR